MKMIVHQASKPTKFQDGMFSTLNLRIGQFLTQRPASASEGRPLSGLDPTTHASLALKDTRQYLNLQNNSAMAYILKENFVQ
ncbi:hypothetical protein Tco_1360090, partial [Tanacetum coccineum]